MGEELLVNEQIDAGAEFVRDFDDYMPVAVACWVIRAESDDVFLYIASDKITDDNFDVAYRQVLQKLRSHQWLDPFQIKLVNSSDPIAQDAIEIRDRRTAPLVTRYGGSSIGGTSIDCAYIYPPVAAIKPTP